MKNDILSLRKEGKTYNEIKLILGCSKGTISFHCGNGQKEKSRLRLIRTRKNVSTIINEKISRFVKCKIRNFKKKNGEYGNGKKYGKTKSKFSYASAYKKIYETKVCFLSGRSINLEDPSSFHLDHITPLKLNGKNTLSNLGVATREANQAKGDLLVEDFIKICIDVCTHNGFTVIKS